MLKFQGEKTNCFFILYLWILWMKFQTKSITVIRFVFFLVARLRMTHVVESPSASLMSMSAPAGRAQVPASKVARAISRDATCISAAGTHPRYYLITAQTQIQGGQKNHGDYANLPSSCPLSRGTLPGKMDQNRSPRQASPEQALLW